MDLFWICLFNSLNCLLQLFLDFIDSTFTFLFVILFFDFIWDFMNMMNIFYCWFQISSLNIVIMKLSYFCNLVSVLFIYLLCNLLINPFLFNFFFAFFLIAYFIYAFILFFFCPLIFYFNFVISNFIFIHHILYHLIFLFYFLFCQLFIYLILYFSI